MGCHFLLQRIFLTQISKPRLLWLLLWQADSLPLSHLGRSVTDNKGVKVQWLSCVQFFATPWTAAHLAPLSFTVSGNLLTFMFIESVILSNHLILCHTLLLLHSVFPSNRVFSNELALHIKWPKYLNFSDSSSNPTPGTIAFQAPLSMGFPGKKCWNDCHSLLQGIFQN